MSRVKRPINRTLSRVGVTFIALICLLVGTQTYLLFSDAYYNKYEESMSHVLRYLVGIVDEDDLEQCIEEKKKTKKYKILQKNLNRFKEDVEFSSIYIVLPSEKKDALQTVISARDSSDIKAGKEEPEILSEMKGYTKKKIGQYRRALISDTITFFKRSDDDGSYLVAAMPLLTSDGRLCALACADISMKNISDPLRKYMIISILLTAMIGTIFVVILIVLIKKRVTDPVLKLERSTQHFARQSNEGTDPGQLYFDVPEINIENEVQSLSITIEQMSYDIKNYVENIMSAEERADTAEKEAEGMSKIAYQDALTRVKSKAAFDLEMEKLDEEIKDEKSRFAMVMVDLNDLKLVNDKYGHNKGDEYLIGSCQIICKIFKHSPVFRIGGDEFVAVLRGEDHANRNLLIAKLKMAFKTTSQKEEKNPWERYSAAVGMGEHLPGNVETAEDVLKRADEEMYIHKSRVKTSEPR